ncbi:hypothetical protein ACIBVK_28985 [Micromonospora echinofusca]|uniref:hypothetical protein n=1 Tax=Micromonospora echinofusca TaxID=47858 RepID=UPI00379597E2
MDRQPRQPAADLMDELTHALPVIGRHLTAPDDPDDGTTPIVAITGPHTTITVERSTKASHRITIDLHTPHAA